MAEASVAGQGMPLHGVTPTSGSEVGTVDREQLLRELRANEEGRGLGRIERVADSANAVRGGPTGDADASRSPLANKAATAVRAGKRYVVAAGDSLSGIAARHYGSKSKAFVAAIVEANRGVISDPNRLSAGVELVLPELSKSAPAGTSTKGRAAEPPAARPPASMAEKVTKSPGRVESSPKFRWYQVKRDDRYMSIARSQLGDPGRWKEVHELNKDRFPDPAKIREGVRIKLPMGPATAFAEGRR